MPQQWIRFVPRTEPATERCAGCNEPVGERWNPARSLCSSCALELELYDRDSRWEQQAVASR